MSLGQERTFWTIDWIISAFGITTLGEFRKNKPKMAYSRGLTDIDYHGLLRTVMDYHTGCPRQLAIFFPYCIDIKCEK